MSMEVDLVERLERRRHIQELLLQAERKRALECSGELNRSTAFVKKLECSFSELKRSLFCTYRSMPKNVAPSRALEDVRNTLCKLRQHGTQISGAKSRLEESALRHGNQLKRYQSASRRHESVDTSLEKERQRLLSTIEENEREDLVTTASKKKNLAHGSQPIGSHKSSSSQNIVMEKMEQDGEDKGRNSTSEDGRSDETSSNITEIKDGTIERTTHPVSHRSENCPDPLDGDERGRRFPSAEQDFPKSEPKISFGEQLKILKFLDRQSRGELSVWYSAENGDAFHVAVTAHSKRMVSVVVNPSKAATSNAIERGKKEILRALQLEGYDVRAIKVELE